MKKCAQMTINPRKRKLLEELPKNNWKVYPSAVKAGYSPQYADKAPKKILQSALRDQAKEALALASDASTSSKEIKTLMIDLIGIDREMLMNTLKKIATNDKDYSSALKVLTPLAKELGVQLTNDDDNQKIVPVLHIGVRETAQPSHIIDQTPEPIAPPQEE